MLFLLADQHFSGRITHLARAIGRSKSVVSTWIARKRLSWQALCEISYVFHVPIVDLITGQSDAISFSVIRPLPLSRTKVERPQRKIAVRRDWQRIKTFLDEVEDGHHPSIQSLSALTARFNTSPRELRRILSDRTKQIASILTTRRSQTKLARAEVRQEMLLRKIQDIVQRAVHASQRPTRRYVIRELSKVGLNVGRADHANVVELIRSASEKLRLSLISGNK